MKDGRELSEFTDAPKGDTFRNPMSRDEIIAKYFANVEFSKTITTDKARQLLDLLENLEEVDNVRRVAELLVP